MRKEVTANIPVLKYIINPVHGAFSPQWIGINKDLILFFRLLRGSMHLSRIWSFSIAPDLFLF